MNILDKKFEQYLAKEGLQPKTQESLNILKRAYFSGATDFYQTTKNSAREARIEHPKDVDKRIEEGRKTVAKLEDSLTLYWKEQLTKLPAKTPTLKKEAPSKKSNLIIVKK